MDDIERQHFTGIGGVMEQLSINDMAIEGFGSSDGGVEGSSGVRSTVCSLSFLGDLDIDSRVSAINEIRAAIHGYSPFNGEPVDFVRWVKSENVGANDYNPNAVAPPEMELLEHSISEDGYTQPIVAWGLDDTNEFEVVDGFHRTRVGKECESVSSRVHGYLPLAVINDARADRNDRIASTIRHNRARGKHKIDAMSDIVIELKNRNWKNSRISRELGMDEDEILRLCQITGLSELFRDDDFSRSWDIDDSEPDYEPITGEIDLEEKLDHGFRTVNTSDESRIFHTYDKWECHKAGFYDTSKLGVKKDEGELLYSEFLSDDGKFRSALDGVISGWPNSCEHYLTNASMNRIAWLGQAAACYSEGLPQAYCGGFNLMDSEEQDRANMTALEYLNNWLSGRGMPEVSVEAALTGRQSTIY